MGIYTVAASRLKPLLVGCVEMKILVFAIVLYIRLYQLFGDHLLLNSIAFSLHSLHR